MHHLLRYEGIRRKFNKKRNKPTLPMVRRALRHDVIIGGGSVGGSRGQGRICLILIVVGHIRPAEIK